MDAILSWLSDHALLLKWVGIASLVMLLASALVMPKLVAKIPVDYFQDEKRHRSKSREQHVVMWWLWMLLKNILAVVLILAGVAMLVLPGQGVLTILAGVMLLDFPGKFKLEHAIVSRRTVLSTLNWIRRKQGCPPLNVRTRPRLEEQSSESVPDESDAS